MESRFVDLASGAEWVRCAFQVNPFSYLEMNGKTDPNLPDERTYNAAMVAALLDTGVGAIGITDHWSADSGETLRHDAEAAGLTVFPGFEATSKEGVHLLVLFDPDTSASIMNRHMGGCGIPADGHGKSTPGTLDAIEILEKARAIGAVVIAPHVTTGGGLLEKLSGQSAINVWRHPLLHAVAPGGAALTQAASAIVENKDPSYRRDNPVAVISAADISRPGDVVKSGSSTWTKLSSLTVGGLDLAFRTPDTRVARTDPSVTDHPRLLGIEWKGGFLDGTKIRFNSSLNVLIGGRGTGKSTVIESIRYVLGMRPLAERSVSEHDAMVQQVLGAGTEIILEIETKSPVTSRFSFHRVFGGSAIVKDSSGQIVHSAPTDIVGDIEIYGQRELADLARDGRRLTDLLKRYLPESAPTGDPAPSTLLAESRQAIIKKTAEVDELEAKSTRLPVVEERLAEFDAAGVGAKLDAQATAKQEETMLDEACAALEKAQGRTPSNGIADVAVITQPVDELPRGELLADAREALKRYNVSVRAAEEAIEKAREAAANELADLKVSWESATEETRTGLDKLLRELQPGGVDGQEFLRLKQEKETLKAFPARVKIARKALSELTETRTGLLADTEAARAKKLRDLKSAAKKVRRALPDTVQASVHDGEDRTPLTDLLKSLGGRLDTARAAVECAPGITPVGFAATCRAGEAIILSTYPTISPKQAADLAAMQEVTLMEMEELEFPVTTDLQLNVGSKKEPIWRSLRQLSTGQRATALLLMLLKRGSGPLIIDQPEDDLDNKFINQDIVPCLREKGGRQIIFSSHNANIPVLGDADQLVVLRADDNGTDVTGSIADGGLGSIDHEELRAWVEELLEGGRDAFNTRRYMYGF